MLSLHLPGTAGSATGIVGNSTERVALANRLDDRGALALALLAAVAAGTLAALVATLVPLRQVNRLVVPGPYSRLRSDAVENRGLRGVYASVAWGLRPPAAWREFLGAMGFARLDASSDDS